MSCSQIKLLTFTLYLLNFLFVRESFTPYFNNLQSLEVFPSLAQYALLNLSISDPYITPELSLKKEQENEVEEKTTEMVAYLTFDDGPASSTEEILDILQVYNAKATFFMIEPQIHKYPDAMLRMRDEGHALASHSVSHKLKVFYQSTEQMILEMETTVQTIKETTGVESRLIRVPFGSVPHMTKEQKAIMAEHGFKLWDWNVDSRDWSFKDGSYIEYTIAQLEKLRSRKKSPVILLHDLHSTAAHLPRLLSYMVEQGYEFHVIDSSLPEVQF